MMIEINHKISDLINIEPQPKKTALFIGDYNEFKEKYKAELFHYRSILYKKYSNFDKIIIPISSPKDISFFNHFIDYHFCSDLPIPVLECYTSADFFDLDFSYENDRLMCISDSIKIVNNPVIQRLPFDRRTPVFHEFVINLLKDQVKLITINNF